MMVNIQQLGLCGILVASALVGGCATRDASVRIVNDTNEQIVLEPAVKSAFLSQPMDHIELAPGEEWQQSWDLAQGSWVLVRFVRPGDINSIAAGSLRLRTVQPGEVVAFHATPDENGCLTKIVAE